MDPQQTETYLHILDATIIVLYKVNKLLSDTDFHGIIARKVNCECFVEEGCGAFLKAIPNKLERSQ